jgi:hypothetical protein
MVILRLHTAVQHHSDKARNKKSTNYKKERKRPENPQEFHLFHYPLFKDLFSEMIEVVPPGILAPFIDISEYRHLKAEQQYGHEAGQEPEEELKVELPYQFRLGQGQDNKSKGQAHVKGYRGYKPVKIELVLVLDV